MIHNMYSHWFVVPLWLCLHKCFLYIICTQYHWGVLHLIFIQGNVRDLCNVQLILKTENQLETFNSLQNFIVAVVVVCIYIYIYIFFFFPETTIQLSTCHGEFLPFPRNYDGKREMIFWLDNITCYHFRTPSSPRYHLHW